MHAGQVQSLLHGDHSGQGDGLPLATVALDASGSPAKQPQKPISKFEQEQGKLVEVG